VGLLAGLVNVVLGVLLLVSPRRSLFALAWIGGWALVVWGVRQAIAAFRSTDQFERTGGIFIALLTIGFGVAVIVVPSVSLQLLRVLLGIAAIVWSLLDTGRPFAGRSRWWGFLVRGLGGLGLGLALIFVPEPTVSLVGILLGCLLLLWGVVEIAASLVLRPNQDVATPSD
jgi:uncharacterized membrane protein HdeD (DUF308 family)